MLASWATKAWARLPLLGRALRLSWQSGPKLTAFWLVLLAATGLLPAATVRVTRRLVDALANEGALDVFSSGAGLWILVMAGLMILTQVLRVGAALIRNKLALTVEDHVTDLIHRAAIRLDLAHFESPEFHDRLYRARNEAARRPTELLESCGALLQNSITLVAMGAILLEFGPWVPLLLLVATLPGALVVGYTYIREHRWRLLVTPEERRAWYYDWLLTTTETAAEMRLYGVGEHFRKAYQEVRTRLRLDRLRLSRQQNLAELFSSVFALAVVGAALLWMAGRTLQTGMSLGQLAMFFHAFQQGLGLGRTLLGSAQRIFASSLFLEQLIELLDLQPEIRSPEQPREAPAGSSITFRGVAFRYPGSERTAIQHVDLEIPAGAVVALLGPNGSGKSTLTKLLTRLYDPDEGSIEIGGVDLRELSLTDLRRRVAVLGQMPVYYNATAAENIRLGNIDSPPDDAAVERAARVAGAEEFLRKLPRGVNTVLGRWFQDGAELSGGQWQRIATARALARDAEIVVLDEPTSSMDPWSEAQWTAGVREQLQGRTLVLITHRLTTAVRADWIVVMRDGVVVEQGSDEQLRKSKPDGLYAQAW